MYMCVHTVMLFIEFKGRGVLIFFSSIAVSFDTTILLLPDGVIGLEWNFFLDLCQCEIRICP